MKRRCRLGRQSWLQPAFSHTSEHNRTHPSYLHISRSIEFIMRCKINNIASHVHAASVWKVKVQWYLSSAYYTSQTHDRKCFTIYGQVAADWHELMIPQHSMRPSIARVSKQLDQWCSQQTYHHPNQPHQAFTPQTIMPYSFLIPWRVGGWVDLRTQKVSNLLKVALLANDRPGVIE